MTLSTYGLREETSLADRVEAEMLELVDQSDLVDQSEPAARAEALGRAVQARR
jgi:hypothetical protein